MEIFEVEIGRHDWDGMRCGCGRSAAHVAERLLAMARADDADEVEFDLLDDHLGSPAVLYEPALPAVDVTLAALAGNLSSVSRRRFLKLLHGLVTGAGQPFELAEAGRDLTEECRLAARRGTWLLFAEIFSGRSVVGASDAFEILQALDEDPDRLARVLEAAGDRLPFYLRMDE